MYYNLKQTNNIYDNLKELISAIDRVLYLKPLNSETITNSQVIVLHNFIAVLVENKEDNKKFLKNSYSELLDTTNEFYNYFKAMVDLKPSDSIVSNYNEYFYDLNELRTILLILENKLVTRAIDSLESYQLTLLKSETGYLSDDRFLFDKAYIYISNIMFQLNSITQIANNPNVKSSDKLSKLEDLYKYIIDDTKIKKHLFNDAYEELVIPVLLARDYYKNTNHTVLKRDLEIKLFELLKKLQKLQFRYSHIKNNVDKILKMILNNQPVILKF